jgi:adenylosuccinate synthase
MNSVVVCDIGFGDAGKGTIVDFLARQDKRRTLVVRYNGGCQAAHHVVLPGGKSHCFSQLGSGTLAGAHTYLSRKVAIDPRALFVEMRHLREEFMVDFTKDVLSIDPECPVTTPLHKSINRLTEMMNRHGSCGVGYGATVCDQLRYPELTIYAKDFSNPSLLRDKYMALYGANYQRFKDCSEIIHEKEIKTGSEYVTIARPFLNPAEVANNFIDASIRCALLVRSAKVSAYESIIFEGAQGTLIGQYYGFHPHTTWSSPSFGTANEIVKELGVGPAFNLALTRTYMVRHGEGPFPTEVVGSYARDDHNKEGEWQGDVRKGPLDAVLLRYALAASKISDAGEKFDVSQVHALAVTHCDDISRASAFPVCTAYRNFVAGRDVENVEVRPFRPGMSEEAQLVYQEELGERLLNVSAVMTVTPNDHALSFISSELNVPIAIESCGPIHTHKKVRIPTF